MALGIKELQQINGIGEVLSRRLLEAGYDSFAKVAAAGEEGLRKIPGVNPRLLGSIVAQAATLSGKAGKTCSKEPRKKLQFRAAALKGQVEAFAGTVRDRCTEDGAGKTGKIVEKEILKLLRCLDRLEEAVKPRVKKAAKSLAKLECTLARLGEAGSKKIAKRLKKARKSLKPLSG